MKAKERAQLRRSMRAGLAGILAECRQQVGDMETTQPLQWSLQMVTPSCWIDSRCMDDLMQPLVRAIVWM